MHSNTPHFNGENSEKCWYENDNCVGQKLAMTRKDTVLWDSVILIYKRSFLPFSVSFSVILSNVLWWRRRCQSSRPCCRRERRRCSAACALECSGSAAWRWSARRCWRGSPWRCRTDCIQGTVCNQVFMEKWWRKSKSTCCIQGSQITPIKWIFNFLNFVNFMLKNAALKILINVCFFLFCFSSLILF